MRSTLDTIVTRVRRLIQDSNNVWTDDDLTDFLDARRQDVVNLALTPAPIIISGGLYVYLDYYSPGITDWEDDLVLVDYKFNTLTPLTSDNHVGHWTFSRNATTANVGQIPPAFIQYGKTFDVYGTSADVLESWAAGKKELYDFGMGRGDNFNRSQMSKMILDLADRYRLRERITPIGIYRSDQYSQDWYYQSDFWNGKVLR